MAKNLSKRPSCVSLISMIPGIFSLPFEILGDLLSERIKTEKKLKKVTKQIAKKLGLGNLVVPVFIRKSDSDYNEISGSRSTIQGFDTITNRIVPYEAVDNKSIVPIPIIEIKAGFFANRKTVKHELYHIAKHFPRKSNLRYWFYEEPAAILYSIGGPKL